MLCSQCMSKKACIYRLGECQLALTHDEYICCGRKSLLTDYAIQKYYADTVPSRSTIFYLYSIFLLEGKYTGLQMCFPKHITKRGAP